MYRSRPAENLGELELDLSRSLKVKYNGAIRIPRYGLLLMFNGNICPNMVPV